MSYYNSPTEHVALVASVGPLEAPKHPSGAVQSSKSGESTSIPSGDIQRLVEVEFGKGHIMYWVALNESGLDPQIANPSGAKGLFQIVGSTFRGAGCTGNVFNAEDNIKCARKLYDARGLKDWEESRNKGFDGGWGKHL